MKPSIKMLMLVRYTTNPVLKQEYIKQILSTIIPQHTTRRA
jgi:hypothetical protein